MSTLVPSPCAKMLSPATAVAIFVKEGACSVTCAPLRTRSVLEWNVILVKDAVQPAPVHTSVPPASTYHS